MKVVEVAIHGLILEPKSQQNVVILQETEGSRILPIWIGPGEALAIRRLINDEPFPRPLTHDLLQTLLDGLKARVTRVVIAELRERTYFANVVVERDSDVVSVDARPSDAIAVALRAKAAIFVNDELLEEPRPAEPGDEEATPRELTDEEKADQLRRFLEKLDPEDFGKFQM
ncbi:MAG: bifunctional nuclease family protein [Candidatus Eisenbacteria bacterium]|uniref:Bifunctional nuclease family protein n=1 Tax=Eiseniibacteriota bacterium TaxID=2212470 RepID=A0A849SLB4_UNCEI|nr:bifunctional nuclease family protein [Candidatus Eisenbacteria bacterium]